MNNIADTFVRSKKDILEAIRRNSRIGNTTQFSPVGLTRKNEYQKYLEWYVFDQLGISPQQLIQVLQLQYSAEDNFRQRRQINVEYLRGRHFNEIVWDPEAGKNVTMYDYLRRRNIPPLTYNVVSKLVRSLTGQFREINTGNVVKCGTKDDRGSELAIILTTCIDKIKSDNKAKNKDAMNMKEMFVSGRPVFKVMWGSKNNIGKPDARFRIVNTANYCINPGVTDYDLGNLHTHLEIHDTTLNDIIMSFANGDYERGMEIKKAYIAHDGNYAMKASSSSQSFDGSQMRNQNFYNQGIGNSAYRYYEVWTLVSSYEAITEDPLAINEPVRKVHKWQNPEQVKKFIDEINNERLINSEGAVPEEQILIRFNAEFVSRFFVIFMTPWGMILDVRESPYKSGRAPYVFPPPDINGEVWGIVEEVKSAQLLLDKQIRQADAIVDNASKGVWLVPDTAVPDTHTYKEYLRELKKVDGAVIYKVREGYEDVIPKQFFANATNVSNNVQQLITLASGLVDEISGNYGAAQGRDSSTKTATGYALESQNAGLNIRDILENYLSVLVERDELLLQFVTEGYTAEDYFNITGENVDPRELTKYQFSIEQSKGTNSPAHRLALEQELLTLVFNQLLPFEVFLDISNNPVMIQAKQKLEEFNKKKAMQQQQVPQGGGGQLGVPPAPAPTAEMLSVQGSPQAGLLQDQGVKQQLPLLPNL